MFPQLLRLISNSTPSLIQIQMERRAHLAAKQGMHPSISEIVFNLTCEIWRLVCWAEQSISWVPPCLIGTCRRRIWGGGCSRNTWFLNPFPTADASKGFQNVFEYLEPKMLKNFRPPSADLIPPILQMYLTKRWAQEIGLIGILMLCERRGCNGGFQSEWFPCKWFFGIVNQWVF